MKSVCEPLGSIPSTQIKYQNQIRLNKTSSGREIYLSSSSFIYSIDRKRTYCSELGDNGYSTILEIKTKLNETCNEELIIMFIAFINAYK